MLNTRRSDELWLHVYNGIALLLTPFVLVKKALKFRRFGHSYEWDQHRWSIPAPSLFGEKSGPRVALVGLGWAEVGMIDKISRRLEADSPQINIIWVLRDVEAREMAQKAFPERAIVPMPFDFVIPQKNFLNAVRPDALIVVEKFWWPNLVWGAKSSGVKVVLVNGRSRGRDKVRYKLMSGFQRWIMRAFDLLLFESEPQIDRVREVLPSSGLALATGNLKWSFEAPQPPPHGRELEAWLHQRQTNAQGPLPILMAGSTSPVDEEWSLAAWEKIRSHKPCTLVIVPRSLTRVSEVVSWLEVKGYKVSLRSQPTPNAEILILDTMGELAYAYRFALSAYVGGSVEGRGHNILEPLIWGVPVAYGPKRGDFEAVQLTAEEGKVGTRLHTQDDLEKFWLASFDETFRNEVRIRAAQLFEVQRRSFDLTVEQIEHVLVKT